MGRSGKELSVRLKSMPERAMMASGGIPEQSREDQTVEGHPLDALLYTLADALGLRDEGTSAYVEPHQGSEGWTVTDRGDLYREPSRPEGAGSAPGLIEQMSPPGPAPTENLPSTVDIGPMDVKGPPVVKIGGIRMMPKIGDIEMKKGGGNGR